MTAKTLNRRQYKALQKLEALGEMRFDAGRESDPSVDVLVKNELATVKREAVGADYRNHYLYTITAAGRVYLDENREIPPIELTATGIDLIRYILQWRDGQRATGYDSNRPGNIKTVEALIAQGAVEEVRRSKSDYLKNYRVTTDGRLAFLGTPEGKAWEALGRKAVPKSRGRRNMPPPQRRGQVH